MRKSVSVPFLYLDDPDRCPVLGGNLCRAYSKIIGGDPGAGTEMLVSFLVDRYRQRKGEFLTYNLVRQRYLKEGRPFPVDREDHRDPDVREAVMERIRKYHLPLLDSILSGGYDGMKGTAITVTKEAENRYLVHDGKNRTSILAALGWNEVPNCHIVNMPNVEYIDFHEFERLVRGKPQWQSYQERWKYHGQAVRMASVVGPSSPSAVLEIGSFGVQVVKGSDTLDMPGGQWDYPGRKPTFLYDIRKTPWPIRDGQYELLIALRVWHHLAPNQADAFREARRVAKNIIIACPEKEVVGLGVPRSLFVALAGTPKIEADLKGWGRVYLWG